MFLVSSLLVVLRVFLQPPEKQQLYKGTTVLEDAKKLVDLRVENDDILALTFQQEGEAESTLCPSHGFYDKRSAVDIAT